MFVVKCLFIRLRRRPSDHICFAKCSLYFTARTDRGEVRWCLPSIRLDQTGAPSIRLSCRHHQHLARTTDQGGQHSSPGLLTHRGQGRLDIYLDTDIYGDDFVNNQLYSKPSIEAAIDRINDYQYGRK